MTYIERFDALGFLPWRKGSGLAPSKLKVIEKNCGLRLMATRDFTMEDGQEKKAGDEWLFEGPGARPLRKLPERPHPMPF